MSLEVKGGDGIWQTCAPRAVCLVCTAGTDKGIPTLLSTACPPLALTATTTYSTRGRGQRDLPIPLGPTGLEGLADPLGKELPRVGDGIEGGPGSGGVARGRGPGSVLHVGVNGREEGRVDCRH